MKIYRIKMSLKAVADMRNIYKYIKYDLNSPQAADLQIERVENAIESLKLFPYRIKTISKSEGLMSKVRRLIVDNYYILFEIDDAEVNILNIVYCKSDIDQIVNN